MRKRLGEVDPFDFSFKTIFAQLQRGKILEGVRLINHHVLLAIDGIGMFSSKSVHCCETPPRDGTSTFITCSVLHPLPKIMIPLMPEPIVKDDGTTKNDGERNACKRFFGGENTPI